MFKLGFIFLLWGILTWFSFGSKANQLCGPNQWQCADGSCIFLVGRCDNFPDCPDNSDEKGCVSVVCKEGQRPCSSGECIDAKTFCDGVIHCKDDSDELAADCRGVILTTTQKSTMSEETVFVDKYALTKAITKEQGITTTTALTPPAIHLTNKAKMPFLTTVSSWLPSLTTKKINRQNKPTLPVLPVIPKISTEKTVIRPKWEESITTKPPDKPTSFHAHPPVIIVPVQIHSHSHSQTPLKWPADWFQATTQKYNNPSRLTTPVLEKTPRATHDNGLGRTTMPYRYIIKNLNYQPTTVKNPCVLVEDSFEFCRRHYRGYYRHPDDCKQYIVCEWGDMHLCTCPNHTHWDLRVISCIWDYASPCITGNHDEPILPDQKTTAVQTTPFLTTTKGAELSTIISSFTTSELIPPSIRLRALPATPAWLKELTERRFLTPSEPPAPSYQSLLTRFFKAIPMEEVKRNVRTNKQDF